MTDSNTPVAADLLLSARDYLRRYGWCQGRFENERSERCLAGALAYKAGVAYLAARNALRDEVMERYGTNCVVTANDSFVQDESEACLVLESAAKRLSEGQA